MVITVENEGMEALGSEMCEIDNASENGLNKKGTEDEGSLPLLHVKTISDDDLVGTASAFPTASDSKAEGEGCKLVSAAELEDMVGSESSEEGPEPFETERADEVNCSVYGSNVNCRVLDVLDVNSDCPAKICGPADQIPQATGSFGMDKSHPSDKGVKPSWADIVEGRSGTNVDKFLKISAAEAAVFEALVDRSFVRLC
ncbi:hypothetical protein U1Q18_009815 [Sarracenia purpurea var. burkii]